MKELSNFAREQYKNRYYTFLNQREYIDKNSYLLSSDAQSYRYPGWGIVIPAGFKRLNFTEKQQFVIEQYLFSDKSLKDISIESKIARSSLLSALGSVCEKLSDERTEIYWSQPALEKAKEIYSKSFSNYNFSSKAHHRLIRRANVTNVVEFCQKPLEDYKKIFNEKTKLYEELENKYKELSDLLNK